MGISLITGLPRNGKSYYCVTRMVDDLVTTERIVYTNLPVHPDILARHVAVLKYNKKTERYLDILDSVMSRIRIFRTFTCFSELKAFYRKNPNFCKLHSRRNRAHDSQIFNEKLIYPFALLSEYWNYTRANSIFYLDECYQIWNYLDASERSKDAKERRKELQNYMRMHGHDGDDIFLITHKERDLDTFILDTLSYRINVRNSKYWPIIPQEFIDRYWWLGWLASLRWPVQFFMLSTYIGDEKLPHRQFFRRCDRFIFRCYDSMSRPNGLKNRGYNQNVASSDLGRSYFKEFRDWLSDSLPAIIILSILIVGAYGFYRGIRSMLQPKKKAVVASAPVTKSSYDLPDQKPKKRKKYYKLVSYLPTALFFDNGLTIRQKEYFAYEEKQYFVTGFDRNFIYCKLNGKDCTLSTSGLELPEDEDSRETRKGKVRSGSLEGFNSSGQSFGQVGQVGQVKTEFQR